MTTEEILKQEYQHKSTVANQFYAAKPKNTQQQIGYIILKSLEHCKVYRQYKH